MLKFFKNLVKKVPKVQKEMTISLDEIPAFIEEHTNSAKKNEGSLTEFFDKLSSLFSHLKKHLKKLERAELRNKKIDKRMLNLMEGNRISYIKKGEIFVNSSKFPENITPETTADFIETYKENIDYFNKNTAKAFYVLKEFFGDNMKLLGQDLKQIDDLIGSLQKSVSNIPSHITNEINKKIQEINNITEKEKSIKEEIKRKEEELIIIKEETEKLDNLISVKKKSDAFLSVSSKTEEKDRCYDEIKEIQNSIVQRFSPVINPLRKLKHSLDEKIIDDYLKDPVSALKKDSDLKILIFLSSLKNKITNAEIQIKDKKRETTLQAIEQISEDYLKKVKSDLIELEKKKAELNSSIISNSTTREISEMTYKLDHLKDKSLRQEEEIVSLKKGLSRYDKIPLLKEIEKDLTHVTSIKVSLTF